MPTYEYACTECGERLEVVQRFSDDPLTVCEACGGKLRKVFSPVGIVFKGSGFYRTDSRNGGVPVGGKSGDGAESPAKSDSNGSGSGDKADSSARSDSGKSDSGKSESAKSSGSASGDSSSSGSSGSDGGSSSSSGTSSSSNSGKKSVGTGAKVA